MSEGTSKQTTRLYAGTLLYRRNGQEVEVLLIRGGSAGSWRWHMPQTGVEPDDKATAHPNPPARQQIKDCRFLAIAEAEKLVDKRQRQLLSALSTTLSMLRGIA